MKFPTIPGTFQIVAATVIDAILRNSPFCLTHLYLAHSLTHASTHSTICSIAHLYPIRTFPPVGISQPVAMAFQFLSSNNHSNIRISVVQEGSVAAIAALLRNSTDVFTFQHCLLAICNLLYEADNHLSIVQQGLIVTLINLSTHENEILKDFCALAFLNLSCAEESRKHAVNGGAVVAIIRLASQPSKITKARCAASLCNLSAAQGNGMVLPHVPLSQPHHPTHMNTSHTSCEHLSHASL